MSVDGSVYAADSVAEVSTAGSSILGAAFGAFLGAGLGASTSS